MPQVTVQPPEPPCPWGVLGRQWGRDLLLGSAEVPRGGTWCFLHKLSLPIFFCTRHPSPTFCCSAAGPGKG